jgi:hypothetical protein
MEGYAAGWKDGLAADRSLHYTDATRVKRRDVVAPVWGEDTLVPRNLPLERKVLKRLQKKYKRGRDVIKHFQSEYFKAADKLLYTDAPEVPYKSGGGLMAGQGVLPVVKFRKGGVFKVGPSHDFNFVTRQPSPKELAILGSRAACPGESFCPVAPGCHICGLTREELEVLDRRTKGGI